MATAINDMAHSGALPQVPVDPIIRPSTRKSSCASTEVTEKHMAIKGVEVDDNQWYPVDDLCQRTSCELHKPFNNIKMKV